MLYVFVCVTIIVITLSEVFIEKISLNSGGKKKSHELQIKLNACLTMVD